MLALARWCIKRRRVVVVAWVALLVAANVGAQLAGNAYSNSLTLPDTQSAAALRLLQAAAPQASGDTEQVVIAPSAGEPVTSPRVRSRVTAMLQRLGRLPHVSHIVSPYSAAGSRFVNPTDTVAFALVTFDRQLADLSDALATTFVDTARAASSPTLEVSVSGQLAENANSPSLGGALVGVILAGAVLLLVFGSLLTAALPLVSALVALGTATGLLGLVSHLVVVTPYAPEVAVLVGLGVGVDYALFIVTRQRQSLIEHLGTEESIAAAVSTSGAAVLFAGLIVSIALLSMIALGVSYLVGLAVAVFLGVALTMAAALTLLPALLGFLGLRVLSRRQRRASDADHGAVRRWTFWSSWARFVSRRPAIPAVLALGAVATIAVPFLSLRPGTSDASNDPPGSTTRTAYDLLARGFGAGFNGPLLLVAPVHGSADESDLGRLASAMSTQPHVAGVSAPQILRASTGPAVGLVNVFPDTAPQDPATATLLSDMRTSLIPRAVAGSGLSVYVGGQTAVLVDFDQVLADKFPFFVAMVVALSSLLLLVAFRSLVIPIISAAMNALSVAAAFGVLVAVFQWGWLGGLIGISAGPVEAPLLVFQFAVLFGLSTDYQVFLVSRIREERMGGGSNAVAVNQGLAITGKTITAAALIMVLVFASFVLGNNRLIKEFGIGFAAGILVDAVLIRMAIVPALLLLAGESCWWLPAAARRLIARVGLPDPAPVPVLSDAE